VTEFQEPEETVGSEWHQQYQVHLFIMLVVEVDQQGFFQELVKAQVEMEVEQRVWMEMPPAQRQVRRRRQIQVEHQVVRRLEDLGQVMAVRAL
jgi:hypothetical protein